MCSSIFLHQPAFAHLDASRCCHAMIGIFYFPVALGVSQGIFVYAVELNDPVFKSLRRLHLPRSNIIILWIPRYNGFCPGPTR
jgi:hypothetical protein